MVDALVKTRKEKTVVSEEDIISEYFKLVTKKDVDALLNLFAEDAVIYEPFSKSDYGLRGKSAIEPFLRVVLMANDKLKHTIVTGKRQESREGNQVTALVTFEKGDKLQGKFTFKFDTEHNSDLEGRIKTLHIEFM
ncbi:MAG: ketosteroid isomerase-like protein [Candidatus Nitrosomirales archaeon]|jgi:ketosteroid isomerase-like protein